jgi:aspartate dehydrogenase
VEVTGPTKNCDFTVETVRRNPADPGAVTGSATYASFFSLLLRAKDKGQGMHLH